MISVLLFKNIISKDVFIDFFILQKYIMILFLIIDLYFIIRSMTPSTWEEFDKEGKVFTWYSGYYHFNKKGITTFLFFVLFSKIILTIQIFIGIDLIFIKIFKNKIKNRENLLYKVFIIIPWIYINLIIKKTKNIKSISKKELVFIVNNFIFVNIWFTSRLTVKNAIIFTKCWKNWEKHTYWPKIKFLKFLKITKKHYFTETENNYKKEYTY